MSRRFIEHLHQSYEQAGKAAALSAASGKALDIFAAHLHNRSGVTIDMGLLRKLSSASLGFGTLTAASTPDFADAMTILAGTSTQIFSTVNNSGYLVQAKTPFSFVGFNVTQAATGGPVYTYQYYDGTTWQTLTTIATPDLTSTGEKLLVFAAPRDWAVGTTGAVGGDTTLYSIRVLATTAPGTAVLADSLNVAKFLHFQAGMADKTTLSLNYPYDYSLHLDSGESLLPYFSTASAANCVTVIYQNGD